MSTQTCTNHTMQDDAVVVVYQANVPSLQPCPLCVALKQISDLKDEVKDLENDIYEIQMGDDL